MIYEIHLPEGVPYTKTKTVQEIVSESGNPSPVMFLPRRKPYELTYSISGRTLCVHVLKALNDGRGVLIASQVPLVASEGLMAVPDFPRQKVERIMLPDETQSAFVLVETGNGIFVSKYIFFAHLPLTVNSAHICAN